VWAHMSASGEMSIRGMRIQIGDNSGPINSEDVENGKNQVEEEL
jgi:hypothetical protein